MTLVDLSVSGAGGEGAGDGAADGSGEGRRPDQARAALSDPIYLLGVGGPEDEAGIGDVSAFVWRFCLVETEGTPPIALGFSRMPLLMAFTRAVNGAKPFTVPTEALKADLSGIGVLPLRLAIDPTPAALDDWLETGSLSFRRLPEIQA